LTQAAHLEAALRLRRFQPRASLRFNLALFVLIKSDDDEMGNRPFDVRGDGTLRLERHA
jgi:hypothetical protein